MTAPGDSPRPDIINGGVTNSDEHVRQSSPARQSRQQRFWQFWIDRGPALTVLALVLSIFQLVQASCAERDIRRIAGSISTQYVDVFPKNMPEIVGLIKRTEHSLTVITDVAAYGHFSNPEDSDNYVHALEALSVPARNIEIEILYYDSAKAREKLKEQFGIRNFDDFKKDRRYTKYAEWHKGEEPQNEGQLYDQIIAAGDRLRDSLKSRGKTNIVTTSDDLQIFMWISDDKEAIFSLHNYGQNPREDSFRTTDERFIARLKEISKAAFTKTKPQGNPAAPPTSPPPAPSPSSTPAPPSPTPSASAVAPPTP